MKNVLAPRGARRRARPPGLQGRDPLRRRARRSAAATASRTDVDAANCGGCGVRCGSHEECDAAAPAAARPDATPAAGPASTSSPIPRTAAPAGRAAQRGASCRADGARHRAAPGAAPAAPPPAAARCVHARRATASTAGPAARECRRGESCRAGACAPDLYVACFATDDVRPMSASLARGDPAAGGRRPDRARRPRRRGPRRRARSRTRSRAFDAALRDPRVRALPRRRGPRGGHRRTTAASTSRTPTRAPLVVMRGDTGAFVDEVVLASRGGAEPAQRRVRRRHRLRRARRARPRVGRAGDRGRRLLGASRRRHLAHLGRSARRARRARLPDRRRRGRHEGVRRPSGTSMLGTASATPIRPGPSQPRRHRRLGRPRDARGSVDLGDACTNAGRHRRRRARGSGSPAAGLRRTSCPARRLRWTSPVGRDPGSDRALGRLEDRILPRHGLRDGRVDRAQVFRFDSSPARREPRLGRASARSSARPTSGPSRPAWRARRSARRAGGGRAPRRLPVRRRARRRRAPPDRQGARRGRPGLDRAAPHRAASPRGRCSRRASPTSMLALGLGDRLVGVTRLDDDPAVAEAPAHRRLPRSEPGGGRRAPARPRRLGDERERRRPGPQDLRARARRRGGPSRSWRCRSTASPTCSRRRASSPRSSASRPAAKRSRRSSRPASRRSAAASRGGRRSGSSSSSGASRSSSRARRASPRSCSACAGRATSWRATSRGRSTRSRRRSPTIRTWWWTRRRRRRPRGSGGSPRSRRCGAARWCGSGTTTSSGPARAWCAASSALCRGIHPEAGR